MCKATNYIDNMFRYLVVILLACILYALIYITNGITVTHHVDEAKIKEVVSTTMREEFQLQEWK